MQAAAGIVSRIRSRDGALVAVLVTVASAVILAFFANSPTPDRFPDTPAYELIADHLPGSFVSSDRLPGYPALIAFASILPGGRSVGLLVLQLLLAVGTVALTFAIGRSALGNAWMAFVAAFLVAIDLLVAGFARVAMSETFAVLLTTAVAATSIALVHEPRTRHVWLLTGLMIVLLLTRPEWALLPLVLLPYMAVVLARRGLLDRRLVVRGIAGALAVLACVGAYSIANRSINGYLGMSSVVNVALLGKVMVYGMEDEAPPPYDSLAPQVTAAAGDGPWPLTNVAPFNDKNHQVEGDFARSVILHDPINFAGHVLGTLVQSSTAYDAAFIRVQHPAALSSQLDALLRLSELRYRAFVLVVPLSIAWAIMGLVGPPSNRRDQLMGTLGVIVLYGMVTAAAATFDEFGRVHLPINPISTVLVVGTLLLNAAVLLERRMPPRWLLLAAILAEVAAIVLLPGRRVSVMLFGFAGIILLQLVATLAGSRPEVAPRAIH